MSQLEVSSECKAETFAAVDIRAEINVARAQRRESVEKLAILKQGAATEAEDEETKDRRPCEAAIRKQLEEIRRAKSAVYEAPASVESTAGLLMGASNSQMIMDFVESLICVDEAKFRATGLRRLTWLKVKAKLRLRFGDASLALCKEVVQARLCDSLHRSQSTAATTATTATAAWEPVRAFTMMGEDNAATVAALETQVEALRTREATLMGKVTQLGSALEECSTLEGQIEALRGRETALLAQVVQLTRALEDATTLTTRKTDAEAASSRQLERLQGREAALLAQVSRLESALENSEGRLRTAKEDCVVQGRRLEAQMVSSNRTLQDQVSWLEAALKRQTEELSKLHGQRLRESQRSVDLWVGTEVAPSSTPSPASRSSSSSSSSPPQRSPTGGRACAVNVAKQVILCMHHPEAAQAMRQWKLAAGVSGWGRGGRSEAAGDWSLRSRSVGGCVTSPVNGVGRMMRSLTAPTGEGLTGRSKSASFVGQGGRKAASQEEGNSIIFNPSSWVSLKRGETLGPAEAVRGWHPEAKSTLSSDDESSDDGAEQHEGHTSLVVEETPDPPLGARGGGSVPVKDCTSPGFGVSGSTKSLEEGDSSGYGDDGHDDGMGQSGGYGAEGLMHALHALSRAYGKQRATEAPPGPRVPRRTALASPRDDKAGWPVATHDGDVPA